MNETQSNMAFDLESLQMLSVKKVENVLIITLNRADKLNALNLKLLEELKQVIDLLYNDNTIIGGIITGSGTKAFAAGADIAEFADFDELQGREMAHNGHDIFNAIESAPKPIIAAVNGFAIGGGCELAMACHMRVATENASFGQPEVSLGIIPGYGGTQRLVQLVGKGKAIEMMLTGRLMDAETALEYGLLNYVYEADELIPSSIKIIKSISVNAPFAVRKIIECVNASYNKDVDGYEFEIDRFASCMTTEDFKEGTRAFLEKRKPSFKGK